MLEALDLSTVELALCALAAIAGAVIQGSVGFGYALVVVPTLLIVAPAAVPVTPLVVALPMVVVQAVAERRALDVAGFARLTAGRLPGTVLGAWVLTAVGQSAIAATAGALLLCAVAASVLRGARSTSPGWRSPRASRRGWPGRSARSAARTWAWPTPTGPGRSCAPRSRWRSPPAW